MHNADDVIACYAAAAVANRTTAGRVGQAVTLRREEADDVVVSGDLHGHCANFERLLEAAELDARPRRHLVLQEVCHGGPTYDTGGCRSHRLLERVAELKRRYPNQVHFLLSNHELAEWTEFPIAKGQRLLNLIFRQGLLAAWGERADAVRLAAMEFIATCPLAVRLEGGTLLCHSVPERAAEGFDTTVFDRPWEPRDLLPGGDVFRLVWGRDTSPENAAAFCRAVGAELVVQGHIPCADGLLIANERQLILDSTGPWGRAVRLNLGERLTAAEAAAQSLPLGSVVP